MKTRLLRNGASVRAAMWVVGAVSVVHFLTLGFVWNFIDSFLLLDCVLYNIVPQHAPLYPLILEFFRFLFNYNDNGAVLICTIVVQQLVFLFAAFQFLQSVRYPLVMGVALCLLYPVFMVQNGIYTEALFASFLVLLLSTAYHAYRKGSVTKRDQLLFCVSILGLTLTRHVGILYAVLPIFITFTLPSNGHQGKWRIIALQATFIMLPLMTSSVIKKGFDTMDVAMYGRPGMHVIEKILNENHERRSIITDKWMAKAKGEDEIITQEIISDTERGSVWLVPRTKVSTHLHNKYPEQDSLLLEIRTDELINKGFQNMILSGDPAVFKQCIKTFTNLILDMPIMSTTLLRLDMESKESRLFEKYDVFRVSYPPSLVATAYWLKHLFSTLHSAFSYAVFIAIIYGVLTWSLSRFAVFLLLLLFAQLVVHSVFTVDLARYSIHLQLTLFFIFVDLAESNSGIGRLKKLMGFSQSLQNQLNEQSTKNEPEMPLKSGNKFGSSRIWKALLAILILAYLGWEIYWYNKVGFGFIKWHAHFMFLLLLGVVVQLFLGLLGVGQKFKENVSILFIGLILTETILIGTGWTKTQAEKSYNLYISQRKEFNNFKNYYWIDDPHTIKTLSDKEFRYTRTINSHGYSDAEWTVAKRPNEFRILCLGDSFTEGDGAHADSSYVSFLRRRLQTDPCPITVMNAGKCGSDPFFNFINYRDLLVKFNPDLIIQTVSRHDLADDIIMRGGMERFGKGYMLSFQNPPGKALELLYAISYTGRIFFQALGYNELLINEMKSSLDLPEVETATKQLFEKYAELSKKNGSQLLVVFLAEQHEVEQQYSKHIISLKEGIDKMKISTCDLRSYYKEHVNNIHAYYWVDNGHHNARGYELMSEGILKSIENNGLLKTDSTCAGL